MLAAVEDPVPGLDDIPPNGPFDFFGFVSMGLVLPLSSKNSRMIKTFRVVLREKLQVALKLWMSMNAILGQ